jgi:hypothetical protein
MMGNMPSQEKIQLKRDTLKRLNKEYAYENNSLIKRNHRVSTNSLKSLHETNSEYIDQLQQRIKHLETNQANNVPFEEIMKIPTITTKMVPIKQQSAPKSVINNESERDSSMKLQKCSYCSRGFRIERIEIHERTCLNKQTKRAPFDMEKMRLKGTDQEKYVKKPEPQSTRTKLAPIKALKPPTLKGKIASYKDEPELIKCTDCGRFFAELPLEKHAPICAKLKQQPKRDVFRTKPSLSIY